jgi:hypothetical protein
MPSWYLSTHSTTQVAISAANGAACGTGAPLFLGWHREPTRYGQFTPGCVRPYRLMLRSLPSFQPLTKCLARDANIQQTFDPAVININRQLEEAHGARP